MLPSRFFFRPSRLFGVLLVAAAFTVATSVLIIPIPFFVRIALAALIAVAFARAGYRYFSNFGAAAVRGMEFQRGKQVALLNAAGVHLDFGDVLYRFVSPVLSTIVIMGGADGGKARRYAIILMPDSLDKETYRRLRLRLNGIAVSV